MITMPCAGLCRNHDHMLSRWVSLYPTTTTTLPGPKLNFRYCTICYSTISCRCSVSRRRLHRVNSVYRTVGNATLKWVFFLSRQVNVISSDVLLVKCHTTKCQLLKLVLKLVNTFITRLNAVWLNLCVIYFDSIWMEARVVSWTNIFMWYEQPV